MTPEEVRLVGDAKRSYDTSWGDSSPVAHGPSSQPLPIAKRPCTPDTRVIPLRFNETTNASRDFDEVQPQEPIEMNGGVVTGAYDNTAMPYIDSDQWLRNFDIDMDGMTANNQWDWNHDFGSTDGLIYSDLEHWSFDPPGTVEMESLSPVRTGLLQQHDSAGLTVAYNGSLNQGFDTCFGTIHIKVSKLHCDDSELSTVRAAHLKPLGSHIGIFDAADDERYRGSIDGCLTAGIENLQHEFAVRVSIDMMFEPSSIAVTIYGHRAQSEQIGDYLADRGLFLQPPSAYDESTSYFNPQYLVPPGEKFETTLEVDIDEPFESKPLRSNQKSRIMQVLDENICEPTYSEVTVSDRLVTTLKEYQMVALAIMAEKEREWSIQSQFPSLWNEVGTSEYSGRKIYLNNVTGERTAQRPSSCLGGILADDMGLGKTLTTLALILGSLNGVQPQQLTDVASAECKCTLIVVPLSSLMSWEEQIKRHIKKDTLKYHKYYGQSKKGFDRNVEAYHVVLTTYDTLRKEFTDTSKLNSSSTGKLTQVVWARVVLDEAHVIRNPSSKIFQAALSLKARFRWCLTGTPIQNSVQDLGSLVAFLRVDSFANHNKFKRLIVDPIGRNDNEGFQKLKLLFQGIALRRTKVSVMQELNLPPRSIKVELVELKRNERYLYDLIKNSGALLINQRKKHSVLQTILKLRQIANHGRDLLPEGLLRSVDRLGMGAYLDLASDACEACGVTIKQNNVEEKLAFVECAHQICTMCSSVTTENTLTGAKCPLCSGDGALGPKKSSLELSQQEKGRTASSYESSSKVEALLRNLEADRTEASGCNQSRKSVIFSCWSGMLNLTAMALQKAGIEYVRFDGAANEAARRQALDRFRNDDSITVFLATIGTAGVGLDLTVASRVHLMEPQWNPMVEKQALDRVFRLGQTRDVLAISYIMAGEDSVDKYIKQIQERKLNVVQICVDGDSGESVAESASQWVESITKITTNRFTGSD